jgi:three-Cys-motif partner protein
MFADANPHNTKSLQMAIDSLPNISTLKYKPQIHNETVDDHVADIFEITNIVPSLIFLDPWGYKGLSNRLFGSMIKDWGCDCIIFFNYARINAGLNNKKVESRMNAIFGTERAQTLRKEIKDLSPEKREQKIISGLTETLEELGGEFVLPFRFRREDNRISHHIVFVSKHRRGYDIMKNDVMANASSSRPQGVPSFEYSPNDRFQLSMLPLTPLDQLKTNLLVKYAGKELPFLELYNQDNVGTCFIKLNYQDAILDLEEQGKVICNPPVNKRRKYKGKSSLSSATIKFS